MIIAALVGVLVLACGGYVWHQKASEDAARGEAALREAERLAAEKKEKAEAKAQAEVEAARQAEEARQAAEAEARNKEVESRRQAEEEAKAKAGKVEEPAQEQHHDGATQTTDGWAIIGRHQRGRFSEPVLLIDGDRPAIGRSYKATEDFRLVQGGPGDDQRNAVITLGMVHRGDSVEVLDIEIAPGTRRGPVYAKLRAVLHPVPRRSR
jgi:hypothetical protein